MIHVGDCLEVMRTLPEASVDAVCTDPPYALAFMSKHWDAHPSPRSFMEWCTEWGREALRVTVPGGYLLAFGGTRTHHRLVCGLEDAGWIIRDELDWIYASGFPKGKANLKPAHEPIVLARKPGPLSPLAIDACRIDTNGERLQIGSGKPGANFDDDSYEWPGSKPEQHPAGRWPSNVLLQDPELFDVANPEVVDSGAVTNGGGETRGEFIARSGFGGGQITTDYPDSGGYSRFFLVPKADRADREPVLRGQLEEREDRARTSASRMDRREGLDRPQIRTPRVNVHPTTKPTDLMRHLVRLVTPTGGVILDPFLGSGTTAIAAELEGFQWIGIEKEAEYVAIAEARLNGVQKGLGLDVPAPTSSYRPPAKMPPIRHDQTTQGHWESYTGKPEEVA